MQFLSFLDMQNSKICIVGLGYVGLPLACLCAKKAFTTFGYDINNKVIEELKKGETIINEQSLKEKLALVKDKITFSSSPQIIKEADVVVVCVPTPINEQYRPNLEPLISSIKTVKQYIKPGALIILESTIFPGTSEEVVLPLLKPLLLGTDFYLAHCPERIDPGNKTWNISNIPRVVGGITEECTVMNVPCMTLRDSTERPETVTIGTNELIGTDPKKLKPAFQKLFAGKWKSGTIPDKWDGKTGARIVSILERRFCSK